MKDLLERAAAQIEALVEGAEVYTDSLICIYCGDEAGEDDDGNDLELVHDPDCENEKAMMLVVEIRKASEEL